MNRLLELQQQLADSAARSDIECHCLLMQVIGCDSWYRDRPDLEEDVQLVADAIEYLTLRGRIARHPDHVDWVRVNFDDESDGFKEHLQKCSDTVDGWPLWKQRTTLKGQSMPASIDQGINAEQKAEWKTHTRASVLKILGLETKGFAQSGTLMSNGKESCIVTNLGRVEWFEPNAWGGITMKTVTTSSHTG